MKLRKRGRPAPVPAAAPAKPVPAKTAKAAPRPDNLAVRPGGRRLGELLVDAELATRDQVVAALRTAQGGTGKRLGELLVAGGTVGERDLARTVARQRSLPVVDLRAVTPEPDATDLLDEARARALTAVPLAVDGDSVVVALADPSESAVAAVEEAIGRTAPLTCTSNRRTGASGCATASTARCTRCSTCRGRWARPW
jgi:hypothetical protein